MVKIERNTTINAPVEKVFAYITNPINLPDIWPCLIEVYDVQENLEGTGTTYSWVYKMAGTRFEGIAEIIEYIPNQRLVVKDKGGLRAVRTTILKPVAGGTKYTIQVEYILPPLLLGRLDGGFLQRLNECEMDVVLENLRGRLEAESLEV